MSISNRRRRPARAGYSIAAVLLLMATIAVMLGMARSMFTTHRVSDTSLLNMFVGCLGGILIGGMLGMSHERRANGMLVGFFVGGISGVAGGAITGGGRIDAAVIVGGSVAILLFAAVVRAASQTKVALDGDVSGRAPAEASPWLKSMSPGQKLALVFVLLTGLYATKQLIHLMHDRASYSTSEVLGRLALVGALSVVTLCLTRLVVRRPAADNTPTELSAIDILDDPTKSA
jgi:hypothetical protein